MSIAILGVTAAPASAQPQSAAPETTTEQTPLYVGAIDEEQAASAGNVVEIRGDVAVLLDGLTNEVLAEVPAANVYGSREEIRAAAGAGALAPSAAPGEVARGIVYGSCGSSYLYMRDGGTNDNDFQFSTGFDLDRNAVDFDWFVTFDGPNGFGTSWSDSGPMWPDAHWTSGWKSEYSGADGIHVGEVTTGIAYAANGTACYSGGPGSSAYAS